MNKMRELTKVMVDVFDGEWPEDRTPSNILYFAHEDDEPGRPIRASLNRSPFSDDIPLTMWQEVRVLLAWEEDDVNPGTSENITRAMFEEVAREQSEARSDT